MTKARHRKESTATTKKIALAATLGIGASVLPATFANAATQDQWERIAACESGDKNTPGSGRWGIDFGHADSTGGLQIQTRTWNDFGGQEFAPTAGQATREQQIIVAERILAQQGSGAWVCNKPGHGIATGALAPGTQDSVHRGGPDPFAGSGAPDKPNLSPHDMGPVLTLVNKARAEAGVPALKVDADLDAYAKAWSEQQAADRKMKHSGLDFKGQTRGENVAKGQDDAAEVVGDWLASEGHRKNILNPDFALMGVAVAHDKDGEHYWTQVFAGGASQEEPTPAPSDPPAEEEPTPEPPKEDKPNNGNVVHTVVKGDTLWDLAGHYYGEPTKWPKIYKANTDEIEDPHWIFPGETFKIPGTGSVEKPAPKPPKEEKPGKDKPAPKGELADLVKSLNVAPESHSDSYNRDLFGDYDREAVLDRDRRGNRYPSIWDGKSYTDASEVDVDHTVALKEAWESGAHAWGESKLDTFGGDMSNLHLLTDEVNQGAKSDNDPAEWLPEKQVKRYVREWTEVKLKYGLSADQAEVDALLGAIPGQSKPPKEDKPKPEKPAPNPDAFPGAGKFGPGANNAFVTRLGEMLLDRGADRFYRVGAGPKWTDVDRRATAAFQRAQRWTGKGADGIPGPLTWKHLVEGTGKDIPKSAGWVSPINARVSDGFNVSGSCISRSQGCHSGVDFSAGTGTPVRAVADARVVFAGWGGAGSAYGRHVILALPDGKFALYGHLSVSSVITGERVSAGETVGLVGSTGNSSGPHLHFEIRNHATAFRAGNFLNPVTYLRSQGVTL